MPGPGELQMIFRMQRHAALSASRMRNISMPDSMSGAWKRSDGTTIEAQPDERGSNRQAVTLGHCARPRHYRHHRL